MFSAKIILSSFLICIWAFSVQAQTPNAEDWSIADYLKNLPEKYKTFEGDFSAASKETTIVDDKNGYAAYLNSPPQPDSENQQFPIFEMALFKSQTKPSLLAVSNLKSDSVCSEYETFFLRRVGKNWTNVKSQILPPLDLKMFWDAPQSSERLLKILKPSAISYHFEPPRQGRQMKVSLEICDFLEDDAAESVDELKELIKSAKMIRLEWNSKKGKFDLAK